MRRVAAILTAFLLTLLGATPALAAPAPLGGGSILTAGAYRCTAAFAATHGGTGVLLTGPGCAAPAGTQFSSNGKLVGPLTGTMAGGAVGLVTVTNTTDWHLVPWITVGGVQHVISGATAAPVGGSVCLLDRAFGVRCGVVTAKNQTVNFSGGVLTGLTRTTVCLSPGSGIAFVSGGQAQGVPIGGSGTCTTSGISYFQPVSPILTAYGLTLLTG